MRIFKLLAILLSLTEITYSQNSDDLVIAKSIKINSTVLGEERTIYVSTPAGYDDSKDSYQVLYVIDGVSEVIGLVNYLSGYGVCPQLIIVSIEEVNSARDMFPSKPEYNRGTQPAKPWYTKKEDAELRASRPGEKIGEADNYLSFIETELFPFIEKNYRTVPYRICCGHSKGGLCVTHAFVSHATMFNAYIALNPSLYWDDGLVMKTAEEKLASLEFKHKLFYFDIGENEVPSTIGDAFDFAQIIKKNASADLRWKLDYLANESHASGTAIGIINALKFIYEDWNFDTDKIKTDGIGAIDSFYKNLSERFGYGISYDVSLLNNYGWGYLRSGQYEEAIKIFKENTLRFPDSPDAYNYLGEAYLAAKNTDMAISSYDKAVELATDLKDEKKVAFLKSRIESINAGKK
ncbi:MAG: alpha/beta hydrolase-fold protein [Bacteroidales bacterium]|nr:alpha/beta hydrolase-fold protein [Bacteroidales bacterium]